MKSLKVLKVLKVMLLSLVGVLFVSGQIFAEDFKVGTGKDIGNYYKMMNDVFSDDYCKKSVGDGNNVSVEISEGSLDNLSGLLNKKFSMGVIQADVLMSQAKKDPRNVNINRMKIMAGLHIETLHLLVPKNYKPSQKDNNLLSKFSSIFNSNSDKPIEISLDILKDQMVAAWGGSVTSAEALSYFFDLNWNVQTVSEDKIETTNMPVLIVGGQPYKPVEKLLATGKYVLVSLNYKEIANKAPFYMPVEATYSINGKPTSVPSIGIQALLIGKAFRNDDKNLPMEKMSECIIKSLSELADDTNTNPNWSSVYELNEQGSQMNWTYFKVK